MKHALNCVSWNSLKEIFHSLSSPLKKVHIHTFYKARKNIEAEVCTNERIYPKTQNFC